MLGTVGMIFAILSFVFRMAACTKGRSISWDDATMGLVVLLAIPPGVFGFMRKSIVLGDEVAALTSCSG